MGKIIAWLLGGKAAPLKKSSYGEASHLRQPEHAPMFNKIRNGGGNQPRKKKIIMKLSLLFLLQTGVFHPEDV